MKRRDLIRRIATAAAAKGVAWRVHREGANHTVYRLDGLMIPIPRHREIGERMAEKIFSECVSKLGADWWK